MATTGKKRGRPPKKSGTSSATRKTDGRRNASAAKLQVDALILFTLSVFFLCVVLISGRNADGSGNVWSALHDFIFGVFGVCAYVWPILIGIIAALCAFDKLYGGVAPKIIESSIVIMLVGAAIDIFSGSDFGVGFFEYLKDAYVQGKAVHGGGFFGGVIGWPLGALFGDTGAKITIILLIFLFLMLATGTTLVMLFRNLAKPAKKIGETAGQMIQMRENNRPRESGPVHIDIPLDPKPNITPKEDNFESVDNILEKKKQVIEKYHQLENNEAGNDGVTVEVTPSPASKRGKTEAQSEDTAAKENKADESEKPEKIAPAANDAPDSGQSYRYPPLSLLDEPQRTSTGSLNSERQVVAERLIATLNNFKVDARIINITVGPAVTRYELQPSAGVKISKITNLADDIALNLASDGVRIEAPIPNKPAVGIEVPNKTVSVVNVREIIDTQAFSTAKSKLTFAVGKDIAGNPVVANVSKMPHGLIAGATGSGKSVCINSLIISLLYKATPDEVKMILIDPKQVELNVYDGIPHLLVPVVTNPRKASGVLGWAVAEMDKRYNIFSENKVRDIFSYNELAERTDGLQTMPQIVIIIDELADLMMTAPHEVEDAICRLAQKARAAGMHLIVATQRPSVNVITGLIKANVPTRIAFKVSSQVDSRTIIDMGGAEKLIGRGDMLFHPVGMLKPLRVQGCFVSDREIEAVVDFVKSSNNKAAYDEEVMTEIDRLAAQDKNTKAAGGDGDDDKIEGFDPMLGKSIECVVEAGQASTSLLQRRVKLGYARAARIIDEMEQLGIVGPYEGSKPRKVLISYDQLLEMKAKDDQIFR